MAYDDTKTTGSQLTAAEYNAFVTEMKTRADTSSGSGVPSSTPTQLGNIYIDTTNDNAYIATGIASSADWEQIDSVASSGDMTKAVYDTNADGTVDAADTAAALTGAQATAIVDNTAKVSFDWDYDYADLINNPAIPVTGVDFDPVGTDNSDDNAVNTLYSGLISNATHTGDVTGSTALTIVQFSQDVNWNSNGMKLTGQTVAGTDGTPVYLSGSNTWSATDASAEATASGMLGLRISATEVLTQGVYTTTGLTAGSTYYLSETASTLTTTKPTTTASIVRIAGYALSTTELFFDPDKTYVENL